MLNIFRSFCVKDEQGKTQTSWDQKNCRIHQQDLLKTRILESEFVSFRLEIHNWIPFHLRIDIQLRYDTIYTIGLYIIILLRSYMCYTNFSFEHEWAVFLITQSTLQFICVKDDIKLHWSFQVIPQALIIIHRVLVVFKKSFDIIFWNSYR